MRHDPVLKRILFAVPIPALLVVISAFSGEYNAQQPEPESGPAAEAVACDQRGVKLAQSGDLAASIEQFRSALRLQPDYADAWYHLGLAYDQARQTDHAMSGFEEALWFKPDYVEARYMLADCCRKRGDFAGELNILAQVVARAPQFAEAHYNYGVALKSQNKPQPAVQEFRAAVRLSPENSKYMLALGIALADVDRKEAVTMLRAALQHGADGADAHYNLGLALATNGDDDGAERELNRALELNPQQAAAFRALGVTQMHEGKLEQAENNLRRALEVMPSDAEAANNLGTVQLRLKDYDGAVQSLERAIELNPNLIKAHANLAQAYQRSGRATDAQRESERVASLTAQLRNRGKAMIDVQSAREQFTAGRKADAVFTLESAIAVNPDFADAYFELGRVIRDSGGDSNEAIAAFRRALSLDPERADAHYEIGLAFERLGRKIDAMSEYRIAIEMAPCNVDARKALAKAAFDGGQWSLAADQFRSVVAFRPQDAEAKREYNLAIQKQQPAR